MTNAELKFVELVPSQLKAIAKQLATLNENMVKVNENLALLAKNNALAKTKTNTKSQHRKDDKVVTVCYNQRKEWKSRKLAISFFYNAAKNCEGSERDRYLSILEKLDNGDAVCSDD